MATETVQITTADGRSVRGAMARAATPDAPAVILIHEWWGLLDETRELAQQLAKEGYTTLAVDLFDGRSTRDPEKAASLMNSLDPAQTTATLVAWAAWLRQRGAARLATLGFCMGGTWSMNASLATPVEATVIFYGWVVRPAAELKALKGSVLAHFGARDAFVPGDSAARLDAELAGAGVPHEIHLYDAEHAFARVGGPHHDPAAAAQAWERTHAFLRRHLMPPLDKATQLPTSRQASFSEIPVICIASLGKGDAAEAQTVDAIRRASEEVGFFYAVDHGVDARQVRGILEEARRFFALSKDEQMKVHLSRSSTFSGFLGAGERGLNQQRPRDLLEAYNVCEERGPDDAYVKAGVPLYGSNPWPDALPGFKDTVLAYYASMDALGRRLLQAFAMALGMSRDAFDAQYEKPISQLRLLHYPAQSGAMEEMLGARPHRDTGMFTILLQDDVGGLEVRNASGDWIVAPPIADSFVVNVGEMMKLLTNDHFASALHRVVNRYGRQRFSVPFFFNPDWHTRLETLPQFIDDRRPRQFEPIHVGEHMLRFYSNLWPGPRTAGTAAA